MVSVRELTQSGLGTFQQNIKTGIWEDTGKTCPIHGTPIYLSHFPKHLDGIELCVACCRDNITERSKEADAEAESNAMLSQGYRVFFNESILSQEAAKASFSNFKVANELDQKALNFGKRIARDYVNGMSGNTILKGSTGVGKTHLSMSIAKKINEDFKSYNQKRTVIFVSVLKLMQLIKTSFEIKDSKYSEERMSKILTSCDYLILDDLGKESTTGNSVRSTSDWKYSFLFNILDNRETTIINTNFSVKELQKIYDNAFVSRITKQAKNNIFNFPETAKDKRF